MNSQTRRRKPGNVGGSPVQDTQAFTRLELAAVLAVLGLLALLALPALANQRERSARVLCVNNLRLAGQGLQQWGTEHGGRLPWRTPWCEGGMSPFSACPGVSTPAWLTAGLYNNVWFHFIWLSNELRTPKILVCPSDAEKTPARTWDASPDGGFANGHYYQNRAVSYLTALDVFPSDPDGLVTGDRNVRFSNNNAPCSSGVGPCRGLNSAGFGIGAGLHVEAGNFLFTDGRVEELSSDGFFKRWLSIYGDGRETHYLTP